jgi:DNA-binding XRE family transcriptional regulator
MPIIGRQCTRDLRTVCPGMGEAALPVNHGGPGLTLVHGWSSEERRAQGTSPSVQGVDFCSTSGRVLSLEFCPWCGVKIASSPTRVRTQVAAPASAPRAEPPPPVEVAPPPEPKRAAAESRRAAPEPAPPPAAPGTSSLKVLREKLGLSQAELGEKLGLARSSVANYENGRAPLSQRLRKWMAKYEKKLEDRA